VQARSVSLGFTRKSMSDETACAWTGFRDGFHFSFYSFTYRYVLDAIFPICHRVPRLTCLHFSLYIYITAQITIRSFGSFCGRPVYDVLPRSLIHVISQHLLVEPFGTWLLLSCCYSKALSNGLREGSNVTCDVNHVKTICGSPGCLLCR